MNLPFEYDRVAVGEFGGTTPTTTDFEQRPRRHPAGAARPHDVVRAGHAQRPARDPRRVVAHGAVGRGDGDRRPQHRHLHAAGDGVPVRDDGRGDRRDPARRRRDRRARQVSVRARRRAFDHGAGRRGASPRRTRACRCCRSTPTPTCASRSWARRTTTPAPCAACSSTRATTQVGIRSLSPEEAARRPVAADDDLLRLQHAAAIRDWIDRVVDSLGETVYITIDCDGLDPAIMPAVGTPEPGGLVVVRDAGAAAAGDRVAAAWSAATSWSCARCPATSRRTSCARS